MIKKYVYGLGGAVIGALAFGAGGLVLGYLEGKAAGAAEEKAAYSEAHSVLIAERAQQEALRIAAQDESERLRAEAAAGFDARLRAIFEEETEVEDVSPDPTVTCLDRAYSGRVLREQTESGVSARRAAALRRRGQPTDPTPGPAESTTEPDDL